MVVLLKSLSINPSTVLAYKLRKSSYRQASLFLDEKKKDKGKSYKSMGGAKYGYRICPVFLSLAEYMIKKIIIV